MSLKYSKDFKQSTIQKILMPGGPTIMEMAVKTGAHPTSIRDWMKMYGNSSAMKKTTEWTPEKKLQAIAHTLNLSEKELGEFLRSNGLHSAELEQWKQDIYSSLKAPGRPRIDPEIVQLRNKEKELSKDLRRKDRALAEMSARVILLKKSHAIFGELEEDE
jgi:transposase-like protein